MLANPSRNWQLPNLRPRRPTKTHSKRGMITLENSKTFFGFPHHRTLDTKLKGKTTGARNKGPIQFTQTIALGVKMGGEWLNQPRPSG